MSQPSDVLTTERSSSLGAFALIGFDELLWSSFYDSVLRDLVQKLRNEVFLARILRFLCAEILE